MSKKIIQGGPESVWLPAALRTKLHQDEKKRGVPRGTILKDVIASHYGVDLNATDLRKKPRTNTKYIKKVKGMVRK